MRRKTEFERVRIYGMQSFAKRTDILGIGYDRFTMEEAFKTAEGLMLGQAGRAAYIVTPNPEIVWASRSNPALKEAVNGADMVIPDGIGVIYASRILGRPLKERVTGYDLSLLLLESLSRAGGRVFLLGARPGVAERAAVELERKYGGLNICGTNDGYFADEEPVVQKINAAAPDLLLVCLGFPKQEIFMFKNRDRLRVGLMMGLGGALDHYAGDMKRASEIWIRLNLEWLQRLIAHPSRIGRMMKLPAFLAAAVIERLRSGKRAEG